MKRQGNPAGLRPLYLLLVGVGAIAAHLASEFAAMGAAADRVLFSPRHWYLGVACLTGIVVLCLRGRALVRHASSGRDFRRMLAIGLRELPFAGKGVAFYAFTAALQFGAGMATEFGEGAPIEGHDMAAGILGALLVVLALAFASKLLARSLPHVVEALVRLVPACAEPSGTRCRRHERPAPDARRSIWNVHLESRPPPALQFAPIS